MRKARAPAARRRATSDASRIPLSLIAKTPTGTFGSKCSLTARSVSSVRKFPVVDPNETRTRGDRSAELFLIVRLSEHVQRVRCGFLHRLAKGRVVHSRDDEQDRVCAIRGGLRDLIAGPHEILAQQRTRRHRADFVEIAELAEEMVSLGEHANRVGPGELVSARDSDRVEASRNQTAGRRCAFYLRDDRASRRRLQRPQKTAAFADSFERACAQRLVWLAHLLLLEGGRLGRVDFLQRIDHVV